MKRKEVLSPKNFGPMDHGLEAKPPKVLPFSSHTTHIVGVLLFLAVVIAACILENDSPCVDELKRRRHS